MSETSKAFCSYTIQIKHSRIILYFILWIKCILWFSKNIKRAKS